MNRYLKVVSLACCASFLLSVFWLSTGTSDKYSESTQLALNLAQLDSMQLDKASAFIGR